MDHVSMETVDAHTLSLCHGSLKAQSTSPKRIFRKHACVRKRGVGAGRGSVELGEDMRLDLCA